MCILESVQSEKSEDTLLEEKKDGLWSQRTFFPPTKYCDALDLNLSQFMTTRKFAFFIPSNLKKARMP
jgi:hypothetical protein